MSPEGLRERKKQKTRQAIADAAMELFAERGFEGTTIADIAEAADIAPRTFFAYFPAKEHVVFAESEAMLDGLVARLADREPGETAIDALRAWIEAVVAGFETPDGQRDLRHRLIEESAAVAAQSRSVLASIQRAIAIGVAADLGDEPDALRPRMVAAAATAALEALDEHASLKTSSDPMALVDTALTFVRGGIEALQDRDR